MQNRIQKNEFEDEAAYLMKAQKLQEQLLQSQKRAFTKWCNVHLNKVNLRIDDLFADLSDGILLIKLLEILSGDQLGKPNKGKSFVQMIGNLNLSLHYLKNKKIELNISAEDIFNKNKGSILGLIWTIIFKFTIANIEVEGQESRKHGKDALLLWCQTKTAGYSNVRVDNFTTSWTSGLALNALIHAYRPKLINFDELNPNDPISNLNNAFDVAEKELGIIKLLEPEDINISRPDDQIIITYISLYYYYFENQKNTKEEKEETENLPKNENLENKSEQIPHNPLKAVDVRDFNNMVDRIHKWIIKKVSLIETENLDNDFEHCQTLLNRLTDKNPDESVNDKTINEFNKLGQRLIDQHSYDVEETRKVLNNIKEAWSLIQKQINTHKANLEAILAVHKFNNDIKKIGSWADEIRNEITSYTKPQSVADAEALIASHEAKKVEIDSYEQELKKLSKVGQEIAARQLDHKAEICKTCEKLQNNIHQIRQTWEKEKVALDKVLTLQRFNHRITLAELWISSNAAVINQHDIEDFTDDVDSLLQKHDDFVKTIKDQAKDNVNELAPDAVIFDKISDFEAEEVKAKYRKLSTRYSILLKNCALKRKKIEGSREMYSFVRLCRELITWIDSQLQLVCDTNCVDTADLKLKLQEHRDNEADLVDNEIKIEEIKAAGEKLMKTNHFKEDQVKKLLTEVLIKWDDLQSKFKEKTKLLIDAYTNDQPIRNDESYNPETKDVPKSSDKLYQLHYSATLHSNTVIQFLRIPKFNGFQIFQESDLSEPYLMINNEKINFGFINMENSRPTETKDIRNFNVFESCCPNDCSTEIKRWICQKCGDFVKSNQVYFKFACSCGIKKLNFELLICQSSAHIGSPQESNNYQSPTSKNGSKLISTGDVRQKSKQLDEIKIQLKKKQKRENDEKHVSLVNEALRQLESPKIETQNINEIFLQLLKSRIDGDTKKLINDYIK